MNTTHKLVVVLALFYVGFIASVLLLAGRLPARVATHFNWQGQPDDWMDRSTHLIFITALGLLLPLFILGIFAMTRWLPSSMINVPHRNYWLAPKQRSETNAYLMRHALWLACGLLLFVGGINYLIVEANQNVPAQLASGPTMLLTVGFLLGVVAWSVALVWHFARVPADVAGK